MINGCVFGLQQPLEKVIARLSSSIAFPRRKRFKKKKGKKEKEQTRPTNAFSHFIFHQKADDKSKQLLPSIAFQNSNSCILSFHNFSIAFQNSNSILRPDSQELPCLALDCGMSSHCDTQLLGKIQRRPVVLRTSPQNCWNLSRPQ